MRKSTILGVAALLAVLATVTVVVVGGAQRIARVPVTLTDFRISMNSSQLPAGVPLTFTVINDGSVQHELVLERVGADDEPLTLDDGKEAEIQDIGPGESKSATWTITQPGAYQLACHVPGHFEAGMVTTFMVTGAGSTSVSAPLSTVASLQGNAPSALPWALAAVAAFGAIALAAAVLDRVSVARLARVARVPEADAEEWEER